MAKIAYSKLKLKTNEDAIPLQLADDIVIAVRQYLPIQEKLALIGRVVELAHEQDANYSNPVKADAYMLMEMVFSYTNLAFTDKQTEDTAKLYDQLCSSGVLAKIIETIPQNEYDMIECGVYRSIDSVYKYQNSVLGILDAIQKGYSAQSFDVEALQKAMEELKETPLMQDIVPLLGLN